MKTVTEQVRDWLLAPADLKVLLSADASTAEKESAERCHRAAEQIERLINEIPAESRERVSRAIVLGAELADGWRCAFHAAIFDRQLERHWRSVKSGSEKLKQKNSRRKSEADAKAREAFTKWCTRTRAVLVGLTTAQKLAKYRRAMRLSQRDGRRLGALLKAGRL
jgi:hypothetical protein